MTRGNRREGILHDDRRSALQTLSGNCAMTGLHRHGDVAERAQIGQAPLPFAEFLADTRLVRLARRIAERTPDDDTTFSKSGHAALRVRTGNGASSSHAAVTAGGFRPVMLE